MSEKTNEKNCALLFHFNYLIDALSTYFEILLMVIVMGRVQNSSGSGLNLTFDFGLGFNGFSMFQIFFQVQVCEKSSGRFFGF